MFPVRTLWDHVFGDFGGILAARSFSTAEIKPSLGRDLAGGTRSVTRQMVPENSVFGDRLYQIDWQMDWRLTRTINVGKGRIQPQLDLYNLLNNNAVLTLNNTYGSRWQQPVKILQGRFVKVGVQVDF